MRLWAVPIAMLLILAQRPSGTVGFQQMTVPDPEGKPLVVGIWYPSEGQASPQLLRMFSQTVVADAKVLGNRLPLVLISHGTGGSFTSHYDTALALAQAGFVVAAVTHTGDNNSDQSYAGNRKDLIDRPRQIKRVLDYLLSTWEARSQIHAGRIGAFGFSLGGFTSLVEIGGTPDLNLMIQLCAKHVDAPECLFVKQRHGDQLELIRTQPIWVHDTRIKAAVIAAPAASFLFASGDLQHVNVPVQLWRAEKDQQAPDQWNSAIVRQELPNPPEEHVVLGVDHFAFLAPCSDALAKVAPFICQDVPGFDRVTFHHEFNRSVIAFFNTELPPHQLP